MHQRELESTGPTVATDTCAQVRHAALRDGGTRLTLGDGTRLQISALPDSPGGARAKACFRRIARAELIVDAESVSARVRGVGHRRTEIVPVSVGTALALAIDGVPTVVVLRHSSEVVPA